MTKGLSIHIGLNVVDPDAYDGWNGQLYGCVNDAYDMKAVAEAMGFRSQLLLNENATAQRVIAAIQRAATELNEDDMLLLTYSGHGSQVTDTSGEEGDGKDETWVLYDRMLLDDELYLLWSQFRAGVRIFMLSDSCHSGTMSRQREYEQLAGLPSLANRYRDADSTRPLRFRAAPLPVSRASVAQNGQLYNTISLLAGGQRSGRSEVGATILTISGCQDNQLSGDGDENGVFTGTLLEVWNNGSFRGSYYDFYRQIIDRMPMSQSPNYTVVGRPNSAFEQQRPFTIALMSGGGPVGSTAPSVRGPATVAQGSAAPSFEVSTGRNTYYMFEIAASEADLDSPPDSGSSSLYFGTWSLGPHLTASRYTLPNDVWRRLRTASRLYYRIYTSSTSSGYTDYEVSPTASLDISRRAAAETQGREVMAADC